MPSTHVIFILIALICFFCAAIGRPASQIALGWLGMFFWALDQLVR